MSGVEVAYLTGNVPVLVLSRNEKTGTVEVAHLGNVERHPADDLATERVLAPTAPVMAAQNTDPRDERIAQLEQQLAAAQADDADTKEPEGQVT